MKLFEAKTNTCIMQQDNRKKKMKMKVKIMKKRENKFGKEWNEGPWIIGVEDERSWEVRILKNEFERSQESFTDQESHYYNSNAFLMYAFSTFSSLCLFISLYIEHSEKSDYCI